MDARIRIARPEDATPLAALMRRLFVEAYADCSSAANVEAYLDTAFAPHLQAAELADPHRCTWIVDRDGAPCGYAQLRCPAAAADGVDLARPAQLHRIYLSRDVSGQGLGTRLLATVRDEARRRGADGLWLSVWTRAPGPAAFYRRHGFTPVGRAVFTVGDDPLEDWIYQQRFD